MTSPQAKTAGGRVTVAGIGLRSMTSGVTSMVYRMTRLVAEAPTVAGLPAAADLADR